MLEREFKKEEIIEAIRPLGQMGLLWLFIINARVF